MLLTKLSRYSCFDPFSSTVRRNSRAHGKSEEDQFYYLSSSSSISSISMIFQVAQTIPSEILIEICSYLHPQDLYSLASVCKRYRSLLWSRGSTTTQQIWRTSRMRYVTNLSLAPPLGMSEQQYIWLMVLLKKCMFCDEKDKFELTMHWEFKMYCCNKCLNEKTVSRKTLLNEWNVPEALLVCFPQLQRNKNIQDPPLYLKRNVLKTLNHYNKLKSSERVQWIKQQENKILKIQSENEKYNNIHDQTRYDHTERVERLLRKLHGFYDCPRRRSA
ncbi:939_t:CDS:2 [Acaulospora morrowiae]|uniref:939_t:CDS:1 n=1 Tax=Acaulospora morrowiae TaxID=94023 RepID=A0A9N9E5A2_9GLOM|nr:939_t:CDS:2 [Acaulospora morrowiae]